MIGHLDGVGLVRLEESDVVRHRLVQAIVRAYARRQQARSGARVREDLEAPAAPRPRRFALMAADERARTSPPERTGAERTMTEDGRSSRLSLRAFLFRFRDSLFGRTGLVSALLALSVGILIWPGLGVRAPLYEVGGDRRAEHPGGRRLHL